MAISDEVNITVFLYPEAAKLEKMTDLTKNLIKETQANEPDVLLYYSLHARDENGQDEIIINERYKSKAALEAHMKTEHYQAFEKAFRLCCSKPPLARFGEFIGGFTSRS